LFLLLSSGLVRGVNERYRRLPSGCLRWSCSDGGAVVDDCVDGALKDPLRVLCARRFPDSSKRLLADVRDEWEFGKRCGNREWVGARLRVCRSVLLPAYLLAGDRVSDVSATSSGKPSYFTRRTVGWSRKQQILRSESFGTMNMSEPRDPGRDRRQDGPVRTARKGSWPFRVL
jgi:hypothetical protein